MLGRDESYHPQDSRTTTPGAAASQRWATMAAGAVDKSTVTQVPVGDLDVQVSVEVDYAIGQTALN